MASIRIILISLWYSLLFGNFLFLWFTSGNANPSTTPREFFPFSFVGFLFLYLANNDIKYYTEFLLRWTFHLTLHSSPPLNLRFHIHISSNNIISNKRLLHLMLLMVMYCFTGFFCSHFVYILFYSCIRAISIKSTYLVLCVYT